MLYNNDIMAMEESGYDVVSAFLDCPIYESYTNYVEAVTESGYMTEAEKIKFRVLEEGALEAIGNALKKAWTAIANFFKFIAGKISDFFKNIAAKKIIAAAKKKVDADEKKWNTMDAPAKKAELRKKLNGLASYFRSMSSDTKGAENMSLATVTGVSTKALSSGAYILDKELINPKGYKNIRNVLKRLPALKDASKIKSKEQADKMIAQAEEGASISLNKNFYRMTTMTIKELREKFVDKAKSDVESAKKKYEKLAKDIAMDLVELDENPDDTKKLNAIYTKWKKIRDYMITELDTELEHIFTSLRHYQNLSKDAEQMSNEVITKLNGIVGENKDNNGYANRVVKEVSKYFKDITQNVNQDKQVLSYVVSSLTSAYKKAASLAIKFAGDGGKGDDMKNRIEQSKSTYGIGESYDPWAEMGLSESSYDSSYDPWAEIY